MHEASVGLLCIWKLYLIFGQTPVIFMQKVNLHPLKTLKLPGSSYAGNYRHLFKKKKSFLEKGQNKCMTQAEKLFLPHYN